MQLTVVMAVGLFTALSRSVPPAPIEIVQHPTVRQALYHMLTATMKGIVALSGLEAVSNGIQFFKHEDFGLVRWGKEHAPRLKALWTFYSGKSGIGRVVQTSFLFYGALTTLFLTYFSIHFNVFDGTLGRSLVGNLSFIGFTQIPGGTFLFWIYQILAVALLAAASMTALQDAQATEWRDVAIGEIPEGVIYRDRRGTFTRSVTITFIAAVVIMLIVRGRTTVAVPFYGIGVFMPIAIMGFAVRKHILAHFTGRQRAWGAGGSRTGRLALDLHLRLADRRQVGRRWVDPPVELHGSHHDGSRPVALADRVPRPGADPPHRAREGTRAWRHGLDRRMAIAEDAGVPLPPADGAGRILDRLRRAPAASPRACAGGGLRPCLARRRSHGAVDLAQVPRACFVAPPGRERNGSVDRRTPDPLRCVQSNGRLLAAVCPFRRGEIRVTLAAWCARRASGCPGLRAGADTVRKDHGSVTPDARASAGT